MGVECEIYLIGDWPAFTRRLSETNDTFRTVEPLDWEPRACTGLLSAQYDFMDRLVAMRGKWTSDAATACRNLFTHLFWSYRGDERHQIVEIGGMKRPFGLDVAWGPETTRRFGEAARRIDLDECRGVFPMGRQHRFETHEEFAEYGNFWLDVVRRGAASCRGLAVVIYG
jgi:hypothetical protein